MGCWVNGEMYIRTAPQSPTQPYTAPHSPTKSHAAAHSPTQPHTPPHSPTPSHTALHSPTQPHTVPHSPIQPHTAPHCPTQHLTVPHIRCCITSAWGNLLPTVAITRCYVVKLQTFKPHSCEYCRCASVIENLYKLILFNLHCWRSTRWSK